MSLTLTYNDDLSRVQVSVTDLPDVETVRVERSTNQLYWTTVRGASELTVVAGAVSVDDYEFSPDVENFYRVVADDAPAGLYLTGASGDYASTPDDPALDLTGDFALAVEATLDTWGGAVQGLVSKWAATAGQRAYQTFTLADGSLGVNWSTDGSATEAALSASPIPFEPGERGAVRTRLDSNTSLGDHFARFENAESISGPWSTFSSDVLDTGPTSVFASTSVLTVGATNEGTAQYATGVVHAAAVYSDFAGSAAVANPDFTIHPTDTTTFVDASGRTWTVHGDARIVGDPVFSSSITPSLNGHAWLKSIRHPLLNRPIHRVLAGSGQAIESAARGGVFDIQGRSVPVAVTDVRSSKEFDLTIQVTDEAAARDMDLVLKSGEVFYLQVPPELVPHMQGGYVRIGDVVQHRPADTVKWRFSVPCTVIAPPGPGVVGTTLTWGTVFNLYGDWNALLAANPTWADLLATVGSPDDLVVL